MVIRDNYILKGDVQALKGDKKALKVDWKALKGDDKALECDTETLSDEQGDGKPLGEALKGAKESIYGQWGGVKRPRRCAKG